MSNNKFTTLIEEVREVFVFEDYLDTHFPKGDKRRGEVLALLGIIHAKVSQVNDRFAENLKATMLITPSPVEKGNFIIWLGKEIDKLIGKEK